MKWALLSILCLLAIIVARADTDYTATVSASSVQLGQPVTVSWTGSCSHSDWTGCYDWIAPFQAQACADGPGRNTCYLNKQWSWVSDDDGSWSVSFEGPGDYEFRFPYCGCGKCEPILDDFAQCAEYDSYGTSPVVRVDPPFNLTKFSPGDQYLLGILWVLFEGSMADIDTLLSKPGSGACTTCFCEVRSLVSQASKFGDDFDVMVNGSYSSLFDQMKTVVSDLATMVQTISDSITECHIDDILGKAVSQDLTASTLRLVSGLEAATEFFKIIVAAENVYTEVSNVRMAWHLKNYFTSGVFTGRVIETILSAVSGRAVAASYSATASVQHQCVLRHPGGQWSPCNCSEPLDLAKFPGNRCKPLSYYSALSPL